jgi:DNA repair protein RadC
MTDLFVATGPGTYRVASRADVAAWLQADVAARVPGLVVSSPAVCESFLREGLVGSPFEVFAAVFLDNRHRVISFEVLFRGTIDHTTVHPREVARRAIELNAAAVILAHNHPSGTPAPSDADRLITRRLREALDYFDVRVLDHFVVGSEGVASMAALGML